MIQAADRIFLDYANFSDNRIVCYSLPDFNVPRSEHQKKNEINLSRGNYNGYMSPKTKSKVSKYLSTWIHSVRNYKNIQGIFNSPNRIQFTFVTLTLSSKQKHTDNEIKRKMLTPFIQRLIRTERVTQYFWRAESQKNGNIHFHIIIDRYIHHSRVRNIWNSFQDQNGYIEPFYLEYGHRNPNSTDIHSFRAIRNPAAYVIKYVTKAQGYRPIKGRIHGCSDTLRNLKAPVFIYDSTIDEYIKRALKHAPTQVIKLDRCKVFCINNHKLVRKLSHKIHNRLTNFYSMAYSVLYENVTPPRTDSYIYFNECPTFDHYTPPPIEKRLNIPESVYIGNQLDIFLRLNLN
jgi:hypothetical protein